MSTDASIIIMIVISALFIWFGLSVYHLIVLLHVSDWTVVLAINRGGNYCFV